MSQNFKISDFKLKKVKVKKGILLMSFIDEYTNDTFDLYFDQLAQQKIIEVLFDDYMKTKMIKPINN